ncbi:tyrosine-type recombinase/integrase [Symbiopectobacterium sp. Eva_TO]
MKKTVPVSAGKLLQLCKQVLKFCRVRRYAVSNALDDLVVSDVGQKESKRDRVLTDIEVGQLWNAINNTNSFQPYYSAWLRILIVFGCRGTEARLSRWDEWDFDNWLWKVPKGHSKNDAPIIRPIPEKIRPYMKKLRACNLKTGYLLGEMKNRPAVSVWGALLNKQILCYQPSKTIVSSNVKSCS